MMPYVSRLKIELSYPLIFYAGSSSALSLVLTYLDNDYRFTLTALALGFQNILSLLSSVAALFKNK